MTIYNETVQSQATSTSNSDVQQNSNGVALSTAIGAGDVAVGYNGTAEAVSVVLIDDPAIGIRVTADIASSTGVLSSVAIPNRIYFEVISSNGIGSSTAAAIRSIDAEAISAAMVDGGLIGSASYNLYAESIAKILSGIQFVQDYFNGWAYNLNTQAPSMYEQYHFNSFAKIGDSYYGMHDEGLFILEGDSDAGEDINAVITTGSSDLGDPRTKKVQTLYAGARSDEPIKLTCLVDDNPEYSYQFTTATDKLGPCRVKVGKGLEGRYWQFEFSNVNGSDIEIDAIDIPFIPNSRRV